MATVVAKNTASIRHVGLDDQHEGIFIDFRVGGPEAQDLRCYLSISDVITLAKQLFRLRAALLAKYAKRSFSTESWCSHGDRWDN